jgi:hypothetical protein
MKKIVYILLIILFIGCTNKKAQSNSRNEAENRNDDKVWISQNNVPVLVNFSASVGQFAVGAANASQIGSAQVNTWNNVLGNNFFTIQTATSSYYTRQDSTLHYTFTFMSQNDKQFQSYVNKALKK